MDFDLSNMKKQTCSKKEMERDLATNKNSHVLTTENSTIPDINDLSQQLIDILKYVNRDDIIQIKYENSTLFKEHVADQFPRFSDRYYSLLMTILDDRITDIKPFIRILEILQNTENSKIDDSFEQYKEELATQYIYPQFGGKENYELKMMEEQVKNMKKSNKKHKNKK